MPKVIPINKVNVMCLTAMFIDKLRENVTDNDLKLAAEEIKRDLRSAGEVRFCPLHKFCDANAVMAEALTATFGVEYDPQYNDLINKAWRAAQLMEFKLI